jgi:serine/threonine-protein kinase
VAEALTADLSVPDRGEAHDALGVEMYLRARAELRAAYHTSNGVSRVAELFDAALALSPRDPRVLAGAALAHGRVAFYGSGAAAEEHAARARDLADRAIALAPQLGAAWVALASVRFDAGDVVATVRALVAGLRVAPKTAKIREMLGRLLLEAGDVERATDLLGEARTLDPSNDDPRWDLARGYALAGRFADADRTLEAPGSGDAGAVMRAWTRARVASWQGKERRALVLDDPYPADGMVSRVIGAYHRLFREGALTARDAAFFDEVARRSSRRIRILSHQQLAEFGVIEGRSTDRVLAHVAAAVDEGLGDLAWMERCPLLADARRAEGWRALWARVEERAAPVRVAFSEA